MTFFNSMTETERFKRFKNHLWDGNFEGVRETFESEFMEEIIDDNSRILPIHFACQNGLKEIVKLLIEKKCNIESENIWGRRPIHFACQNGHTEKVKLLIEKICNIESQNNLKLTPIHFACRNKHFEIVELLIENKCNIESYDKDGWRPIHFACKSGCLEIVKLLIEKKCNIESKTKEGWRPIYLACRGGFFEIVKLLIEQKYKKESETKKEWKAMHLAFRSGHKEIVKLYNFQNCFNNVTENDRKISIDLAKSKGQKEMLKFLSELNKVAKQINNCILENNDKGFAKFYKFDVLTGQNWLEMALEQKADKIIKYFLNRPIDANEIGYIEIVTQNHLPKSRNIELWEEVILYKTIRDHHVKQFQSICKPNIINRPTKIIPCSFLELAVENENILFVLEIMKKTLYDSELWKRAKEIALNKGFYDIHNSISNREYLLKCRQKNNISILHTAVCDNDPEMLEYILSEGLVDPNHNHEVFGTALAFAILLCHRECLTVFERYNINGNTQNKYLQNPLHEAISNGMIEHCQYLMNRVEDIDQPGFLGYTALHCAVIRGCEELCDQLIEKGADCFKYIEVKTFH